MLVFKEAPEVVYTGLTKVLGKPRELEKNIEDATYFDQDQEIIIPLEDTNEYAKYEHTNNNNALVS